MLNISASASEQGVHDGFSLYPALSDRRFVLLIFFAFLYRIGEVATRVPSRRLRLYACHSGDYA
jgi:hypothetical protein